MCRDLIGFCSFLFFPLDNDLLDNENNKKYCQLTESPANGQYKCDELKTTQNQQYYRTGSICQIQCDPTYSIPFHLYQMSTIQCNNGAWNSTDIEVCYKEQPKRRHISQQNGFRRQSHSYSRSKYRLNKSNTTPKIWIPFFFSLLILNNKTDDHIIRFKKNKTDFYGMYF